MADCSSWLVSNLENKVWDKFFGTSDPLISVLVKKCADPFEQKNANFVTGIHRRQLTFEFVQVNFEHCDHYLK